MTLQFLGPESSPLLYWLRSTESGVLQLDQRITVAHVVENEVDFIISYGYRHKVPKDVLEAVGRAVNLHISFLPWNRGADPNLWSFIENTPKGVSIHYMDEGIDTGDIIVQKSIEFDSEAESLATTYKRLHEEIQALFQENWASIKAGTCDRVKQPAGAGTCHRSNHKDALSHLLSAGWETPIKTLCEYADKAVRLS